MRRAQRQRPNGPAGCLGLLLVLLCGWALTPRSTPPSLPVGLTPAPAQVAALAAADRGPTAPPLALLPTETPDALATREAQAQADRAALVAAVLAQQTAETAPAQAAAPEIASAA